MGNLGFDPYYEWLGIPRSEQPADFYRLLGVARFEQNATVIQRAADRQMGYVRQFQAKYPAEVSNLLSELSQARITLTDQNKRPAYDRTLVNGRLQVSPTVQETPRVVTDRVWYVQVFGIAQGPFTFDELQARIKSREVRKDSLVCNGQDGGWMLATEVRGLFDFRTDSPPAPGTLAPKVVSIEPISSGPDLLSGPLPEPEDRSPGPNVWVCGECRWPVPKPKTYCPRCGYVKTVNDARTTEHTTAIFLMLVLAVGLLLSAWLLALTL